MHFLTWNRTCPTVSSEDLLASVVLQCFALEFQGVVYCVPVCSFVSNDNCYVHESTVTVVNTLQSC